MSESLLIRVPQARQASWVWDLRTGLSSIEQISLAFFAYFTAAALAFHVESRELSIVIGLNVLTIGTLMALIRNRQRFRWVSVAANLFPALLLLVAYRESGLWVTPDASHHFDQIFIQWDRVLLGNALLRGALQAGDPWIQYYLEFAYLLCYALVPLGVAAVYFSTQDNAAMRGQSDCARTENFWAVVLLATLFTYAIYPFFPLTPPRVLFNDVPGPHVEPLLRKLNFWLLNHYGVQACIFPSGHVAATTATALAVRKYTARFGGLFLFAAVSVAVATVVGRYHYLADAIAGAVVAVVAYELAKLMK